MPQIKIFILSFIIFGALGCSRSQHSINFEIDVTNTINKYELKEKSNWITETNDSLQCSILSNTEKDLALLIIREKNGDTLLKYFGNGVYNTNRFEILNLNNNRVLKIPHCGRSSFIDSFYAVGNNRGAVMDLQNLSIDSIMYYQIDQKNQRLIPIKRACNDSLIALAKRKGNFKGKLRMVCSPQVRGFKVAVDTLTKSEQHYYVSIDDFGLEQNGNEFTMVPQYFKVNKKSLYINNISTSNHYLGNTLNVLSNDQHNSIIFRYHIRILDYIELYCNNEGFTDNKFIKREIIRYDEKSDSTMVISTFNNDSLISGGHLSMFRYSNGEYFIGGLPPNYIEAGYIDKETGTLYHLDTTNWRLKKLIVVDHNKMKYKKLQKNIKLAFLTGDIRGEMSGFIYAYEIVQIDSGFGIKRKHKYKF